MDQCLCGPGYEDIEGNCNACSVGTFKSSISNAECTPCSDHKPNSGHTSLASKLGSDCECNKGYTLNVALCEECEAGKYKDLDFSDNSCNVCNAGYYCPRGSVDPTPCFGNSTSDTGQSLKSTANAMSVIK